MPSFLKYGSTGRPPGKFHIRHSPKKITENLESPSPPFDIFSIEKINNNNNIICCYDNGGIICNEGVLVDSKAATPATINYKTSAEAISTEDGEERLADRLESNRCKYKYKFNIDGISTTTAATPAPATMAEGISNEGGEDTEAPGLSEWFADRFESNRCNSKYKYKYKFNIDGISTTTTTTNAPATPATATINYKTSTEGTSNEGGEEAEAVAGLSERFANLFESNRCNSISNNNNNNSNTGSTNKDNYNKTFHHFVLFKLIYLIITKSFSSKQFTKESKTAPKEKQQQQQHYHGKQRHQFHLEQQQHEHHNVERMVTSIVLKLSLVAWDMWAFRNVF
jgi:hypothetical protein